MGMKLANASEPQIEMSGLSNRFITPVMATYTTTAIGQEVIYLGKINGGPQYRTSGVITQLSPRRAIVEMIGLGKWHIPYRFLSFREVA